MIKPDPDNPRMVLFGVEPDQRAVRFSDMVNFNPIDEKPLGRFNASLAIGYNHAKSNSLSQFSSRIVLRYQQDTWSASGFLDMVTSSQDNTEDLSRTHGAIFIHYYLTNDWFLLVYTDLLSNDEQKLKLRAAVSAGIGKFVLHNNRVQLSFSGGGVYNHETYSLEGR
jgi:hypothetical protein